MKEEVERAEQEDHEEVKRQDHMATLEMTATIHTRSADQRCLLLTSNF